MKRFFALLVLFLTGFSLVKGQGLPGVDAKFGKGIKITAPDSSFALKFTARFQTLFVGEKVLDEGTPIEKQLLIRRSRLKFSGFAFSPKFKYKLELAVSNRDNGKVISEGNRAANIVLDAFFDYYILNDLYIRGGQFKLPGNRERVISSQNLQFVDRSLVNSRYTLDRDKGLMLGHQWSIGQFVMREYASVTLGQGRNVTIADSEGLNYVGRVEFLPFGEFVKDGDYFGSDLVREETPKLSVGVGYGYNDDAFRDRGERGTFFYLDESQGTPYSQDLGTFFADLMFKYQGFSVLSEYMHKNADNPIVPDDAFSDGFFRTGDGFVVQAGYLFKNDFEIAARYTTISPDEELLEAGLVNNETEYTLGFSRYIVGHNLKIQSDISYTTLDNDLLDTESDPELRFRLQVEVSL